MIDTIAQWGIMILGPTAVVVVGWKNKYRRWGYIIGTICQPLWFITIIYNEQWPILIAAAVYTYGWINGVWNFWIKPKEAP